MQTQYKIVFLSLIVTTAIANPPDQKAQGTRSTTPVSVTTCAKKSSMAAIMREITNHHDLKDCKKFKELAERWVSHNRSRTQRLRSKFAQAIEKDKDGAAIKQWFDLRQASTILPSKDMDLFDAFEAQLKKERKDVYNKIGAILDTENNSAIISFQLSNQMRELSKNFPKIYADAIKVHKIETTWQLYDAFEASDCE